MGFFEMLGAFVLSAIFYLFTSIAFGRIIAQGQDDTDDKVDTFIVASYLFGMFLFVIVFIFWSEGVPCPFASQ